MKVHPYANLFPLLPEKELQRLADDIAAHGQVHEIITDQQDRLVDGRNRLLACERAKVEPKIEKKEFADDQAVLAFIRSVNDIRRHLNTSQRALIAAKLANIKHGSNRFETKKGVEGQNYPSTPGVSLGEAADMMDVSRPTVKLAKKILGKPRLEQAVENGILTVAKAASMTKLPQEKQDQIVAQIEAKQAAKHETNGAAHRTTKKKAKKTKSSRDDTKTVKMLAWASRKDVITDEEAARHLDTFAKEDERPTHPKTMQRVLDDLRRGTGFIVTKAIEGYRVRRAVHFARSDDQLLSNSMEVLQEIRVQMKEIVRRDQRDDFSKDQRFKALLKLHGLIEGLFV